MKVDLIMFLVKALEVLGLIFVILIVFNLIINVGILAPIQSRTEVKQKQKMMDEIIKQLQEGKITPDQIIMMTEQMKKSINEMENK